MEGERQEKIMTAEASILNLEIPGELAYVYNKLDEWNPAHFDRHITSVIGDVVPMDMKYRLPGDINSHVFSKYTSMYFKNPNWGVTMEPLSTALTKVQGEQTNRQTQSVFKLILRYMHDKTLGDKKEKVLADYIVQQGLQNESLRDEIYCQLVNQTWQNQNLDSISRVWQLMAHCLSAFPPSQTLFKYLLKYVSDVGMGGHKWFCQHKALQCAYIEPQLSRIYPPCLLEWRAAHGKANMALEVKFADNVRMFGHVESWTSGEDFAKHLLSLRGFHENNMGWTVVLQEDVDYYELMALDYVFDLISEMEIPPGFPVCRSHFLVWSDRTKESQSIQRPFHSESPLNPERERHMILVNKFPEPLKIDITKTESRTMKQHTRHGDSEVEFSMTSVLNKRPQGVNMDGLSESKLNLRYSQRKAGPTSQTPNGHMITNGSVNGDIDEIGNDLSQTGLNRRYNIAINGEDMSPTILNQRYLHISKLGSQQGASDKTARKFQEDSEFSDNVSVATGHSNWSHWVEDVFSDALNDHVDGLMDARSVKNRLKGGGQGIPGPVFQQTGLSSMPPQQNNGDISIPVNGGIPNLIAQPVFNPAQPTISPQLQQQMMANQQAYLQAYIQAQAQAQAQANVQSQAQQRQQQQALFQAASQQPNQQPNPQQYAAMQSALQQQMLQQQMLQQHMLQAALQHQLQSAQQVQQSSLPQAMINMDAALNPVQAPFYPAAPETDVQSTLPSHMQQPRMPVFVPVSTTRTVPITIQSSTEQHEEADGKAKRVFKIKHHFEKETVNAGVSQEPVTRTESVNRHMTQRVASPPPPPMQFVNLTPRMAPEPPAPPPPPPPPPPLTNGPDVFDKDKGTFTFRDKTGRARTVHIGRVVWPPPQEKEEKKTRDVGRLEIDEKIQRELDEKIKSPTQVKKVQKTDEPPKDQRPSKHLTETVHLATLQLLEQKLGGATEPPKALAPPPPPKPKAIEYVAPPAKIVNATQTASVQDFETQMDKPQLSCPQNEIDYKAFELVITELYRQNKDNYLTYSNVPWTLHIRKEVFMPGERLDNSLAVQLLFCQVVQDVYNNGCVRINKDDRIKMKALLDSHGIYSGNYLTGLFKLQVKHIIIDTAREWPTYFCRLFPVASGGHLSGVHFVGVSHSGIYLLQLTKNAVEDCFEVIEHLWYEDIVDVLMPSRTSIQIRTKNKPYVFYTNHAQQMKELINRYLRSSNDQSNKHVVAMKDYKTRESTVLSFKQGDVIKLRDANVEEGWLYGVLNGMVGYFPADYVRSLARHEVEIAKCVAVERTPNIRQTMQPSAHVSETTIQKVIHKTHNTSKDSSSVREGSGLREALPAPDNYIDTSQNSGVPDGKFSMMEFALLHFRESVEKKEIAWKKGSSDLSWKDQAEMVKWTRSPIQTSLLRLESAEMNKLAIECFICIMTFMEDYPMSSNQTEIECVLKVLKVCHKYPELRDEVYCQLCKQTTNSRSMKPRSCLQGWRFFAIVAAYSDCSETLRPYLFKYLESTAADPQSTYSGAAAICQQNLRKTFKYGGRKNVPLKEEISALANGRISKRFSFIYSGSEREGMLHIKPCTVVHDCCKEICGRLDIMDQIAIEEYTLFLRTRDGQFSRLRNEDYILDVTAELLRNKQEYDLVFQRIVWYFPIRTCDNLLYNELMYFQCIPDYADGLLVITRDGVLNQQYERDIQFLAALLHRASDHVAMPSLRDLEHLLPKMVCALPGFKAQYWLNHVQDEMRKVIKCTPNECMAKFVEVLAQWSLFGSTFFRVKKVLTQPKYGECILAVNKTGAVFLNTQTHEIFQQYSFSEILSTRRYRSDSHQNYLDIKIGNLIVQKIVQIETEQGPDISNLIGQYLQVINRHRKRP